VCVLITDCLTDIRPIIVLYIPPIIPLYILLCIRIYIQRIIISNQCLVSTELLNNLSYLTVKVSGLLGFIIEGNEHILPLIAVADSVIWGSLVFKFNIVKFIDRALARDLLEDFACSPLN
jgi:hypothetical protein